jgi:molybdopterin converting factor small subunit
VTAHDVEIHLFAAARAAVGASIVAAVPGSLGAILDGLALEHPAFATVRPRCSYRVDGTAVHGEDVDVAPGSRVDVLPPFAGG